MLEVELFSGVSLNLTTGVGGAAGIVLLLYNVHPVYPGMLGRLYYTEHAYTI